MNESSPSSAEAPRLKVVFVGHVDHGKSTLIGRIFYDTDSLPEGKVESIQAACDAEGMEFEYAFLLDALLEEQEQNITIDTTQIQFRTNKRNYVIIDAPGHREFIKNMVTGAASADAAVLLIDAKEGLQQQSYHHGYLLSMLGVNQVIVAVNKMDLIDYKLETYEAIKQEYTEFLKELGIEPLHFIPVSARQGENITQASEHLPWYRGPSIVQALDSLQSPPRLHEQPLRLVLQDVYRFDERRILAGRIESGSLRVGDRLLFSPSNKVSQVASIERWNHPQSETAIAGESIGITLSEQIFVERGHVASHEDKRPITTNRLKARLFWMGQEPLKLKENYTLKLATQEAACEIISIDRLIDASTLKVAENSPSAINKNDVAEITLHTRAPLVLDNHDQNPLLGRFVIMQDKLVGGGGIIFGGEYATRTEVKSSHITWSEAEVTYAQRAGRQGHQGAVIWLTGLSGSGKSTIAKALEHTLFQRQMQTYVLDGDNIRYGLNANLGFSPEDREENIRRVAEVAKLMADAGLVVITAFISPYKADRRRAREIALGGSGDFVEVFVDAPLEVCEERDPKKLYQKARAGEIKQFTGIDAPYEAPEDPEITVKTAEQSIDESVAEVLEQLLPRLERRLEEAYTI